jgi:hypothetical protein
MITLFFEESPKWVVKAKSSYAQISEKRLKSHNQKFKPKEKEKRLPKSYFFSRQKEKRI